MCYHIWQHQHPNLNLSHLRCIPGYLSFCERMNVYAFALPACDECQNDKATALSIGILM